MGHTNTIVKGAEWITKSWFAANTANAAMCTYGT